MAAVVRRPHLRSDRLDIREFVADDDAATADGGLDRIEAALIVLASNPFAGLARADLAHMLRSFPVGDNAIFPRPIAGVVSSRRLSSHDRPKGRGTGADVAPVHPLAGLAALNSYQWPKMLTHRAIEPSLIFYAKPEA